MERQRITTFQQAAAYLDETPRFTSKHTVEETKAFLHRLGDPDRRMRILHVAQTGKVPFVPICAASWRRRGIGSPCSPRPIWCASGSGSRWRER